MLFNTQDYSKNHNRMQRIQQDADTHRLIEPTRSRPTLPMPPRWLIILTLLVLFGTLFSQPAHAQDITIAPTSGGSDGVLPDTMRAFQLGHYYFATGDYERAEELFDEAIAYLPDDFFDFVPEYAFLYLYLAESQFRQGDYTEAARHFERYLEITGEDALLHAHQRLTECEQEQRANAA